MDRTKVQSLGRWSGIAACVEGIDPRIRSSIAKEAIEDLVDDTCARQRSNEVS